MSTTNTANTIVDATDGAYVWGVTYSGDLAYDGKRRCVEDSTVTINNT